jgi:hypothetical protein
MHARRADVHTRNAQSRTCHALCGKVLADLRLTAGAMLLSAAEMLISAGAMLENASAVLVSATTIQGSVLRRAARLIRHGADQAAKLIRRGP